MKIKKIKKVMALAMISLLSVGTAMADDFENATTAVKNMGMGWNLGNTLEANGSQVTTDVTSPDFWGQQSLESETCWGQPKATKELITMMKNAGFGAIRVPVTWYNHMDSDGNVNAEWMARVKEVVNYVIDNGMYCILNVHHDTGADGGSFVSWLKADETNYTTNKARYEKLWTQIATEFKDYDQHLLFEAYNEMLDAQSTWNAPKNTNSYNAINSYAQSFVDAVRATGGNNSSRNIIANTYAAANNDAVSHFTFPTDQVSDHFILEVHAYPNFYTWTNPTLRTIEQIKADVDYVINNLKSNVINKGYAAIIGEWSSSGVDNGSGQTDYDLHKDMFFEFCRYFIQKSRDNGIGMFYWMGLSDGDYRSIPAFNQADLAEVMAKAYHGDDFQGEYPTAPELKTITTFEGEKALGWGDPVNVSASSINMIGYPFEMTVSYKQTEDPDPDMQFWDGQWSGMISFTVDGVTYNGDFSPKDVYGSTAGTELTTTFSFDQSTFNTVSAKGLLFQGIGITVYKVVLTSVVTEGVETIQADAASTSRAVYNIAGQQVGNGYKGLVIKNGKKVVY